MGLMGPSKSDYRKIALLDKGALKRVLRVRDLFAVGYGDLGSSIYYALGMTALYALGASPIALMLAGLVFACTALTYAEMSSAFPDSGGSASFARHAFNDLISFIAGWGLLLDYIVTIAISAFAIGPYLNFLSPLFDQTHFLIGFTIALIIALYFMNFFGVKHSTRVSGFLVCLTLITQVLIIILAFATLFEWKVFLEMQINVKGVNWSPDWSHFWKGTAMAMVAYTGIESIAQLGAETRDPAKSLPRASLLALFVLLFMYLGLSLSSLLAIDPQALGTTYLNNPIGGIAAHLPYGSKFLVPWVGIMAACLLFVASNAGLIGASRLAYNMGEYYQLPRFFYQVHPKFRTPAISLAFFAIVASVVVLWSRGKLVFLGDLYNFGAMIAFFFAHLSLIVLRIKKPDMERPFRAPFNIKFGKYWLPIPSILGLLGTFAVWCQVIITKPYGRNLGFVWMVLGTGMYLIYRRRQKIEAAVSLSIEKIKIAPFKPLVIKKILIPITGETDSETIQMACELSKFHNSQLSMVHVIEVPATLPFKTEMPYRTTVGESLLQKAEAIARDLDVQADLQIISSRSAVESILQMLKEDRFDLIVIGSTKPKKGKRLGKVTETLLRKAPCRIWISTKEKA